MKRVELLDTSILLEILGVPFESDSRDQILAQVDEKDESGVELLLPAASVVEAGDHVGRIDNGHDRRVCARRLHELIEATLSGDVPWSFEPLEWDADLLALLLRPDHPTLPSLIESLAAQYLEMGDMLIIGEFQRLRANLSPEAVDLDVWTKDASLRGAVDGLRDSRQARRARPSKS